MWSSVPVYQSTCYIGWRVPPGGESAPWSIDQSSAVRAHWRSVRCAFGMAPGHQVRKLMGTRTVIEPTAPLALSQADLKLRGRVFPSPALRRADVNPAGRAGLRLSQPGTAARPGAVSTPAGSLQLAPPDPIHGWRSARNFRTGFLRGKAGARPALSWDVAMRDSCVTLSHLCTP